MPRASLVLGLCFAHWQNKNCEWELENCFDENIRKVPLKLSHVESFCSTVGHQTHKHGTCLQRSVANKFSYCSQAYMFILTWAPSVNSKSSRNPSFHTVQFQFHVISSQPYWCPSQSLCPFSGSVTYPLFGVRRDQLRNISLTDIPGDLSSGGCLPFHLSSLQFLRLSCHS